MLETPLATGPGEEIADARERNKKKLPPWDTGLEEAWLL